jgi:hypothetical protein
MKADLEKWALRQARKMLREGKIEGMVSIPPVKTKRTMVKFAFGKTLVVLLVFLEDFTNLTIFPRYTLSGNRGIDVLVSGNELGFSSLKEARWAAKYNDLEDMELVDELTEKRMKLDA